MIQERSSTIILTYVYDYEYYVCVGVQIYAATIWIKSKCATDFFFPSLICRILFCAYRTYHFTKHIAWLKILRTMRRLTLLYLYTFYPNRFLFASLFSTLAHINRYSIHITHHHTYYMLTFIRKQIIWIRLYVLYYKIFVYIRLCGWCFFFIYYR